MRDATGEWFISWYEPEHYTLELALPFFQERFRNMRWSILTPCLAAHWDMECLTLTDAPDAALYPAGDAIETYWLDYYESIFNPARVKQKAMLAQMPRKYWKNLPEATRIDAMIRSAPQRVQAMLAECRTEYRN